MTDFLQRLKQRKLVQWAVAYLAAAWVVLQVLDLAVESYGWPNTVMHIAFGVLALGFVVVLVLAWYHGERGAQRVGGVELLIIALVLAVGGGLLWHFSRPASSPAVVARRARSYDAAVCRSGPCPRPAAQRQSRSPVKQGAAVAAPATSAALLAAAPIAAQPIPAKSVAVLPFENLSTDKGNAYFADGMQDLILTKLADIGDLKVIARTSTMQYGSHPENLTLVGQQLGVATILEGSVQKAGNQVLINVQLIDAKTDAHIWAQDYTRTLDNIFGVEGEVAEKVAKALDAKLTAQETATVSRIPTTNPQAYTLYLRALHGLGVLFVNRNTESTAATTALVRKTADELRQAITLDPKFAAAYGNLAWLEINRTFFNKREGIVDKQFSLSLATTHARKALSLQPDSPIALTSLGLAQLMQGSGMVGMQAMRKAARLAPGNARVNAILTRTYFLTGAWTQAYATAHQAVRIDPRNATNYSTAANTSIFLKRYADARQMLERGLAVSPDNAFLHSQFAQVLKLTGDFAGARAALAQLPAGAGYHTFWRLAALWRLSRNCTESIKAARKIPPPRKNMGDVGGQEELVGRCQLVLGDTAAGRATLTHGRTAILAVLPQHPRTAQQWRTQTDLRETLAYIEAWLGDRAAALHAIDQVIASDTRENAKRYKQWGLPLSPENARVLADYDYESKAELLAHFGDAKGATDILRELLQSQATGDVISPALLRLAPVWDPIRHDPAFQALLKKFGNAAPANTSTAAPAPIISDAGSHN